MVEKIVSDGLGEKYTLIDEKNSFTVVRMV
jgi:hypothetical protein